MSRELRPRVEPPLTFRSNSNVIHFIIAQKKIDFIEETRRPYRLSCSVISHLARRRIMRENCISVQSGPTLSFTILTKIILRDLSVVGRMFGGTTGSQNDFRRRSYFIFRDEELVLRCFR